MDGALALALPTRLGQSLEVQTISTQIIEWTSFDEQGNIWLEATFSLPDCQYINGTDIELGKRLESILKGVAKQKPEFWSGEQGWKIETKLDFPRKWGLGTSSTLIANLANWAGINPYLLLDKTFGGSGYDIACATAKGPLFYELSRNGDTNALPIVFNPPYKDNLFFVYLGKKQNSREGLAHYRKQAKRLEFVKDISAISRQIADAQQLQEFEALIQNHEMLIAETLDLKMVKSIHFADYWGKIKSLGAWGGDFVLATSNRTEVETKAYFNERGFDTVLKYDELIL